MPTLAPLVANALHTTEDAADEDDAASRFDADGDDADDITLE